nr:MAG TPA: hypothetical protein [Caudoviricetes sp.]
MGAVFLFLPLSLLAEHKGKKFVPLFGSHAVQQAGKFLPHRIGRRRIFAQQVADGAVKILCQYLHLCHGGCLASLNVIYETYANSSLAARHRGFDTFCDTTHLDILHKKFLVHDDLILYVFMQSDNYLVITKIHLDIL